MKKIGILMLFSFLIILIACEDDKSNSDSGISFVSIEGLENDQTVSGKVVCKIKYSDTSFVKSCKIELDEEVIFNLTNKVDSFIVNTAMYKDGQHKLKIEVMNKFDALIFNTEINFSIENMLFSVAVEPEYFSFDKVTPYFILDDYHGHQVFQKIENDSVHVFKRSSEFVGDKFSATLMYIYADGGRSVYTYHNIPKGKTYYRKKKTSERGDYILTSNLSVINVPTNDYLCMSYYYNSYLYYAETAPAEFTWQKYIYQNDKRMLIGYKSEGAFNFKLFELSESENQTVDFSNMGTSLNHNSFTPPGTVTSMYIDGYTQNYNEDSFFALYEHKSSLETSGLVPVVPVMDGINYYKVYMSEIDNTNENIRYTNTFYGENVKTDFDKISNTLSMDYNGGNINYNISGGYPHIRSYLKSKNSNNTANTYWYQYSDEVDSLGFITIPAEIKSKHALESNIMSNIQAGNLSIMQSDYLDTYEKRLENIFDYFEHPYHVNNSRHSIKIVYMEMPAAKSTVKNELDFRKEAYLNEGRALPRRK